MRRWKWLGIVGLAFGIALIPIGLFDPTAPAIAGDSTAETQMAIVAFVDNGNDVIGKAEFAIADAFDTQGNDGTMLLAPSNNATEMSPPTTTGNFSGFNGSTEMDGSLMSATCAAAG